AGAVGSAGAVGPAGAALPAGCLDQHLALADDPAVPAHHLDAGALGPVHLTGVVVVGDPRIAPQQQRIPVHLWGGDPRQVRGGVRDGGRAQQRLRGDARVVGAFTAQQLALDDHRGEVRALDRVLGDVLADGPAAEHDDVGGEVGGVGAVGGGGRV